MSYTERARALRPYIEKASISLPDEDALQAVELFPQWVTGHSYAVDDRLAIQWRIISRGAGAYLTGRLDTGYYTGTVCDRFTRGMAGICATYGCA